MADNNSAGGASYKANQTGGAHAETSAVRRHYQLGTRPGLATSLAELHQASITVACPGVDAAAGDDDNDEQGEQGDDEQNGGDDDDDDELGEQTSIGRTEVAASYTNTTATASGADGSYSNEYLRLDSLSDCEARYHCRPTSSASSSSPSSAAATIGLAGGGGGGQGQLITSRQESRGQSATSTTGHQRAAPNQVFACDTARNSNPTSNGNSAQVVVVDVGTSRHCSPDATRRQPLCRRSWQPRIQQQQQQQQQLEFGAIEQQHSPRSSSRMLPVAQQQHHLSNHLHTSGSGDGEQQQQQQGQLRATFASFAGGGRIEHAPGDGRAASSCASSSSSSLRNKIFERGYEIHIIHPEPAPRQEAIESLVNQSSIGIDNKEKWYKCSTSSTDTNTSDATARLASACLEQVNKCGRGGNQDNKASRQETNSTRDAARTGSATATTGQEYRLTMMIDQSTTTTTSTKQKTTTITPAPTETMTENLKQYPPNHPLGNSKHLCAICGDRATGKHYGVFSCEGCKGFFKRTIRKDIVYVCRAQGCCLIDMRQRNRCQYCRYQKCLTCGMKREAVQEEKQRLKLRAAAAGQQQQSQLQQQQQQQQSQQHQISSDTSNNQNQNHIFNQCDTSADLSQNKLDSSTSMPHYNHYNLEATHNNNDHHHHHHHNHHHHSQLLASSSSSPPSSYRNNCNTSPHIFNATTTTPNSHNNNYDHHPLGPAAIYQQSGFGSSIAPAATTNLRPGMRINELTLKWAAQVQIECLIDWAKSVPKFTGLLIDDQVTLLRAYWNELIIAHIAFKTAEALRDGSMPGVGRHDKLNSLCIGRGIFIDAIQAHEIGLGNMFDRIIDELVVKMRDMRIDANELACLRAIILFNPESHGLKTSQPIEEYRGDIYTTLETYCRRHYEDQPNRFGKLLLRLPALRSIGLKCDSMRPYQQQQQQRRCDNNNINHHHHLVTTSTTHYNNSHHQVPRCSPTGGRGSSSPTSSSVSSISSSTSTTSSSSGMTTTASITTTTGAGAVPASYKFGYQVNLLFFGLCYEMSSIDSFLRESLTLN